MTTLNIPNLNTLIAHLEAQPEQINMAHVFVRYRPDCGTVGCILGHADLVFGKELGVDAFDPDGLISGELYEPDGYISDRDGARRYPPSRVIATLKRLRDHYLATGEVKIDWGPEPGAEPAHPWAAPQAVEVAKPSLPVSLTRHLDAPAPVEA